MQPSSAVVPMWMNALPVLVLVLVLAWRMSRPMRGIVVRLWNPRVIVIGLAGWLIYATDVMTPAPAWQIAVGVAIGVIVGIPAGFLRGKHTDVRPAEKPGVMYLGTSWQTALVFIGAFVLRFAARELMPHAGNLAAVTGDACMGFAMTLLIASYFVIFRKYEVALAQTRSAATA